MDKFASANGHGSAAMQESLHDKKLLGLHQLTRAHTRTCEATGIGASACDRPPDHRPPFAARSCGAMGSLIHSSYAPCRACPVAQSTSCSMPAAHGEARCNNYDRPCVTRGCSRSRGFARPLCREGLLPRRVTPCEVEHRCRTFDQITQVVAGRQSHSARPRRCQRLDGR